MTLLRILGLLWSLPGTLIGLLLALPYGARSWAWDGWALVATADRAIGNPGAQTWGVVIFAVGDRARAACAPDQPLGRHERHHVWQGMVFGPLFLLLYGGEWLVRFAVAPGPHPGHWPRWYRAYYHLSWERAARRAEAP